MWSHSACQSLHENSFGREAIIPQNIKLRVITVLAVLCIFYMSLSKANSIKDWLSLISGQHCALNIIIGPAIVATCEADVL